MDIMVNDNPILLIEDDNIDALTIQRAFDDIGVENSLIHVYNGEEAIRYLDDASNQKPYFILLDLNMPKMNGHEFLRAIKDNEELKQIPVVVLTTSKDKKDISKSFDLNVAGYLVKTFDYDKFVEIMRAVQRYWKLSQTPAKVHNF